MENSTTEVESMYSVLALFTLNLLVVSSLFETSISNELLKAIIRSPMGR